MLIAGIDPGKAGGVAVFRDGLPLRVFPIPIAGDVVDVASISNILRSIIVDSQGDSLHVFIEQVGAMPGQGVTSMFNFGRTFGRTESVALVNGWPLSHVRPQAWKKVVLEGTDKSKDATIAWVRSRFPSVELVLPRCRTPHDGMADAVCIAHYGCLKCIPS